MGKIGNFEYPECKITDSIQVAEVIEEQFKGKVKNQDALCKVLGHSSVKSGGYIAKITALRRYGLVSGRGEIATTKLAKRVIYPTSEEEKTKSIAEAIGNVDLFKRVFERLGENTPSDDFWVDLVEITGEDRSVAQKDAIKLRNLYMDGHRYLVSVKKPEKPEAEVKRAVAPTDALFELRTRDYGTLIVKDEESITVARKLIEIIEAKLKGKGSKEAKQGRTK